MCPLWPETLQALPHRASGPILRCRSGLSLERRAGSDPLALRFLTLTRSLGVTGGFYSLRRAFRTMADDHPDRAAVDMVMGHESRDVGSVHYVTHRDVDRCRSVVEHVRGKL